MKTAEIRKAIVALVGSIAAMVTVLGLDAGGISQLFTADRIDTLATIIAAALMIYGTVWGVPNETPANDNSAPLVLDKEAKDAA